jgi:hypothetical protein
LACWANLFVFNRKEVKNNYKAYFKKAAKEQELNKITFSCSFDLNILFKI